MPRTIDLGQSQQRNSCRINSVIAAGFFCNPLFCANILNGVSAAFQCVQDEILKPCDDLYENASTPTKHGISLGSSTLDVANVLLAIHAEKTKQATFLGLNKSDRDSALAALVNGNKSEGTPVQVTTRPPRSHAVTFGKTNGVYWVFDASSKYGTDVLPHCTVTIFRDEAEMMAAFPKSAMDAEFATLLPTAVVPSLAPQAACANRVINEYYMNFVVAKPVIIRVMPKMDKAKQEAVMEGSFVTQTTFASNKDTGRWAAQAQWRMITSECMLYGTPTAGPFADAAERVLLVITSGTAPADVKDVREIALAWLQEQDKAGAETVVFPTLGSPEKDAQVTQAITDFFAQKRRSVTKVIHLISPQGKDDYELSLAGTDSLIIGKDSGLKIDDVLQYVKIQPPSSGRVGLINPGSSPVIGGKCTTIVTEAAVQVEPAGVVNTLETQIADFTDLLFQQSEELNGVNIEAARNKVAPPKPPKTDPTKESDEDKKKRHLATINLGALNYVRGLDAEAKKKFVEDVYDAAKDGKPIVSVKDENDQTKHYYKVPALNLSNKPDDKSIDKWLDQQIAAESKEIPVKKLDALQKDLQAKAQSKLVKLAMEMDEEEFDELDEELIETVTKLKETNNSAIMTLKPDYKETGVTMIRVKPVNGVVFKDNADMVAKVNAMALPVNLQGHPCTVTAKIQDGEVVFCKNGKFGEGVITDADFKDYATKNRNQNLGQVIMDALQRHVTNADPKKATFVYAQVRETEEFKKTYTPRTT